MRKKLGRKIDLVHSDDPPEACGECVYEHRFAAISENKGPQLDALIDALKNAGALRTESEEGRARLCLDEALVNALMHGSKYDPEKSVSVAAYVEPGIWSIRIEDEGAGFRDEDLPDPDAPENLLEESGRGVHLMRSLISDVSYWRSGRVLLLKQRRANGSSGALPANKDAQEPRPPSNKQKTKRKRAS